MTREEVVEELQYIHDGLVACDLSYEALEIAIKTLSVDLKPVVRGEWIEDGAVTKCSVCGNTSDYCGTENFCHNCGADMRGGNDDNQ